MNNESPITMSIFDIVKAASQQVDSLGSTRTSSVVCMSATTEMGELAEEVLVSIGQSYKKPGPDGVVGEAIDVILCLLDLIHVTNPEITEEQVRDIAHRKLAKWIKKETEWANDYENDQKGFTTT